MLRGLPEITHQEVMELDSVCKSNDPKVSCPLPAAASGMGKKARRQTNSKSLFCQGMLSPLRRAGDL